MKTTHPLFRAVTGALLGIILSALLFNYLNLGWATSMATPMVFAWNAEYLYHQQHKKLMLGILSNTRDKMAFASSLAIFEIFSLLPDRLHFQNDLGILFLIYGIGLAILNYTLFASREAKERIFRRS